MGDELEVIIGPDGEARTAEEVQAAFTAIAEQVSGALRLAGEVARQAIDAVAEAYGALFEPEGPVERPKHSKGYVINSWDRRRR